MSDHSAGAGNMVGTLRSGEPHPAALDALARIRRQTDLHLWLESFASCSIDGDRAAELCGETLRRLLAGEPVGDRSTLGLAWTMRQPVESRSRIRRKALTEVGCG